jgi:phosphoglycolate phosphatase-like HAD superfamily hydrolase
LDHLVYDCAALKARALRESLIPFAESIAHEVNLPDAADAEEGFLLHGSQWIASLSLGLSPEQSHELDRNLRIREQILISSGGGKLYPGMLEFLQSCRQAGVMLALGAEAARDYLLAVCDRHDLDGLFDFAFCSEEFGACGAEEMIEDIIERAEVALSETLVLGTRAEFFQAAKNLNIVTLGCGWGIHERSGIEASDCQALTPSQAFAVIQEIDRIACERFE